MMICKLISKCFNINMELKEINKNSEYRVANLKFVVIGDSAVGKTNIITRYTEDNFSTSHESTIGVELKKKSYFVDGIKVKEQVWDTAGSEKYQSVCGVYFKGSDGALVVYDISNKESFNKLKTWIYLLKQHSGDNVEIFIIGNKVDLEHKRQVSYDEAFEFSQKQGKLNLKLYY